MTVENAPPEVFTLLPQNGVKESIIKVQDGEKPTTKFKEFDPFAERDDVNPTSDCQTFTHLLKSTLGSGIMSMPFAFKSSGIVGGILGGLFMAAICTHTSYILIDCAHILYVKARKSKMEYPEVVSTAFATGPTWCRKYAKLARKFVVAWLFLAYFGACVVDNTIIATNYGQVIRYYLSNGSVEIGNGTGELIATDAAAIAMAPVEYNLLRTIMGCVLVPLVLFILVPNLKYLAPISTIANFFMATVLIITLYYLVQDLKPINELSLFQSITEAPQFFSITLFAMENIGVMMPLENNMRTPRNFLGTCGVLNRGMFVVTVIYLLLGALGYAKYGENVNPIITTNLPVTDVAAQIVKLLIGSTVLFTFSLQFYVCHEMVWKRVGKHFPNRPRLAENIIRVLLVIACVSIAIAVPRIGPLVTLVGAFGFSLLGIIFPGLIDLIVYWDVGYGRYNWKMFKDGFLILLGILFLIFGTQFAINDIVTEYL